MQVLSEDGSVLFVASDDNSVYALKTAQHVLERVLWTFATGKGVDTKAALSPNGDTLFIGSYDKNVYALATPR